MMRDRRCGGLLTCALLTAWAVSARFVGAQSSLTAGELTTRITTATDVRWLEDTVSWPAAAAELPMGVRIITAKAVRTLAYARLGELATAESLAAVRRIDAAAARIVLTPLTSAVDVWPHVGWFVADTVVTPIAQTTAADGTTYAIVSGNLLGGFDFFLISSRSPADLGGWSRPKLVDRSHVLGVRRADLRPGAGQTLSLTFTFRFTPAPRDLQISLLDVNRDSDGDGWTDLEEARLETDPHDPDSDGDGMPDGADVCPLYPASNEDAGSDSIILQKAVFAAFGLTGSRQLLYVTPDSPRVHVFGYGGPILFDHPITKESLPGGPHVSWRIADRTATTARVELSDREAATSGGGQDVLLRKIGGFWVVVSRKTTWVS
jgi:Bacterial TSP3 repeat